jgi:Uncharacterized conserved protein (DUF2190)
MPFEVNLGEDLSFQAASTVSAITKDANGNYSSGGIVQYSAVKLDASGAVPDDVIVASTGDIPIGIIQTAPATGPSQSCAVRCTGISKAIAGAAVTVGAQVYVGDSSGRLKVVPAAGATGVVTIGLALTPATAVGDIFTIAFQISTQAVTS